MTGGKSSDCAGSMRSSSGARKSFCEGAYFVCVETKVIRNCRQPRQVAIERRMIAAKVYIDSHSCCFSETGQTIIKRIVSWATDQGDS